MSPQRPPPCRPPKSCGSTTTRSSSATLPTTNGSSWGSGWTRASPTHTTQPWVRALLLWVLSSPALLLLARPTPLEFCGSKAFFMRTNRWKQRTRDKKQQHCSPLTNAFFVYCLVNLPFVLFGFIVLCKNTNWHYLSFLPRFFILIRRHLFCSK